MPNSEALSSWPDLIKSRSRERPRDAVQLVEKMVKLALTDEVKKIDDNILSAVMPKYSQERAELVAGEYAEECPELLHVIRSMSRLECSHGAFLADAEAVKKHLITIQSSFTIHLNGLVLKPTKEEDIFNLWSLLFQAGIFYPRVTDDRQREGYRFILPHEDPGLLVKARWNDIQQTLWEIHPVFRDFLIVEQREQKARFGLATKHRSKGRR
ncbi:hypothetical protein [Pseudomonas asplenii]|uniref:hypothetical protein n=1 Tax=Pseudomonas asplenii TaxID=53407 RepID=UPI0006B47C97|nr:hypothetical protein [Pseudomonas fuscovaginae]